MTDEFDPYAPTYEEDELLENARENSLKHSGLGIASFILSLLIAITGLIAVVLAGVLEASTPGGVDEESSAAVAIGCTIIIDFLLSFVAVGLGIGGLCQKNAKKTFAIIGTILSGMIAFGLLGLVLIGVMVS